MDNLEKLRPIVRQRKKFLDAGFDGEFEMFYEFVLIPDHRRFLAKAIEYASDCRTRFGDEMYFYMAGYIDSGCSCGDDVYHLYDNKFSFVKSALHEYHSRCSEEDSAVFTEVAKALSDAEAYYEA